MLENRTELEVDARLENIPKIIDFVVSWMQNLKLDDSIPAVETSVDEACTNIINHAYSEGGGIISITCEMRDNELIITIGDTGKPFDPSSVLPPDLEADLDARRIGGLGIYLMRKLMDDVSYSFDAEEGNTLIMRKILTSEKPKGLE